MFSFTFSLYFIFCLAHLCTFFKACTAIQLSHIYTKKYVKFTRSRTISILWKIVNKSHWKSNIHRQDISYKTPSCGCLRVIHSLGCPLVFTSSTENASLRRSRSMLCTRLNLRPQPLHLFHFFFSSIAINHLTLERNRNEPINFNLINNECLEGWERRLLGWTIQLRIRFWFVFLLFSFYSRKLVLFFFGEEARRMKVH